MFNVFQYLLRHCYTKLLCLESRSNRKVLLQHIWWNMPNIFIYIMVFLIFRRVNNSFPSNLPLLYLPSRLFLFSLSHSSSPTHKYKCSVLWTQFGFVNRYSRDVIYKLKKVGTMNFLVLFWDFPTLQQVKSADRLSLRKPISQRNPRGNNWQTKVVLATLLSWAWRTAQ